MAEDRMLNDEILLGLIKANSGGGGGTTDYDDLNNKPQIGGVTLSGNKSASDLGLATTTDLAGKQDALTFDSVPTDGSTNPVESNGVYDALALKQNATDNSLETEAKTIVGAINEHEGDVSSLKSGLTTLDTEVNGDAVVYPYADVITIPDAVPANVADCTVKIEPVQDLHGYDHPWVGGAGKNKCILLLDRIKAENTAETWNGNVYVRNGVTITVQTDDDGNVTGIKLYGVCTSDFTFYLFTNESITFDTDTIINGRSGVSNVTLRVNTDAVIDTSTGATIPANTEITRVDVRIRTSSQGTAIDATLYPMIRLSTETDATFAPYTNICPITGHTEASVTRAGKNLCYAQKVNNTTIAKIRKGKTYTFSCDMASGAVISVNWYKNSASGERLGTGIPFTFTADEDFDLFINGAGSGGVTFIDSTSNYQIELGSTATPYVPYAGKTYTIALGDTIYGGTVDFDSGVMTVDRVIVDLGTLSWTETNTNTEGKYRFRATASPLPKTNPDNTTPSNIISSDYQAVSPTDTHRCVTGAAISKADADIFVYDERYSGYTGAQFGTAMDGVQLVYELATPTTIQLTPQQIQLLKGQNTLTASTGQISVTVNGVSGSIGAVQEQVNELVEEVGENQIYSDTPVQIGTVGDKPLYRLFVTFETPISSVDNAYTSTGINSEDIELILRGDGINADGTYYGHLAFDPTYNNHQTIGVKGVANIKYVVIEYI